MSSEEDVALDNVLDAFAEAIRTARSGQALMAVTSLVLSSAEAINEVFKIDDSPDLYPELKAALDSLAEAGEHLTSAARVIDARFEISRAKAGAS